MQSLKKKYYSAKFCENLISFYKCLNMVHMNGRKFEMRKFEFIYDVLDFTFVSAAVSQFYGNSWNSHIGGNRMT